MSPRALLAAMLAVAASVGPTAAADSVVLVVTAGGGDYLLHAGGTLARMIDGGAVVHVLRVANDEKVHGLAPQEAGVRAAREAESAARLLGAKGLVSLGYRTGELAGVSATELRDRIVLYIRHYRPDVLFIPDAHAEYDEVLDRYYAGAAAEEAWVVAGLRNVQPPHARAGLEPHRAAEVYYYAPPVDRRRRELEGPAAFVPQPIVRDIGATFDRKLQALRALRTLNRSVAVDVAERLAARGRKLPLLDTINDKSIDSLLQLRVRNLARMAAEGTPYSAAEEFHYAGLEYQIPASYLGGR